MSDSNARPVEVHFRGLSAVDRRALPLLSSMVDGEIYAAEMLNARGLGVTQPGIYCGYIPKVKSGLTFTISIDKDRGYSAGVIETGLQQFHIIQQHDIDITVETGYKWFVVLEAFYEQGVATKQVSSDSDVDAASVRAIRDYELNDSHQIICEIDLTSGKTSIDMSDFDITNRNMASDLGSNSGGGSIKSIQRVSFTGEEVLTIAPVDMGKTVVNINSHSSSAAWGYGSSHSAGGTAWSQNMINYARLTAPDELTCRAKGAVVPSNSYLSLVDITLYAEVIEYA